MPPGHVEGDLKIYQSKASPFQALATIPSQILKVKLSSSTKNKFHIFMTKRLKSISSHWAQCT
jgi:CRP-like cAMP-binding protein